MAHDVRTLVHRFYDEAWNDWEDSVVEEILAPEFVFRGSLGDEVHGRNGWRAYRDKIRTGSPDFHNEILDLVISSNRAAARLRYTGHHHGPLLGVPATGSRFSYAGAAFFTAAHGRLTSAWVLGDLDTLRRGLTAT